MTVIRLNKDCEIVETIRKKLKKNDGYCPCALEKTPQTKCMCEEFRKSTDTGLCHCGLYERVDNECES